MYKQGDKISDYIFPLVKAKRPTMDEPNYSYTELIGTGFLIGTNGYALTAGHVIDQLLDNYNPETDAIVAMFQQFPDWYLFEINEYEKHPDQDVGLIKLYPNNWKSIISLNNIPQNSSCEYHCWGYPHEIAKELQKLEENANERPDLIYTQGYIRRRISRELFPTMIFKGNQFYELSETVGGGNSGGPILLKSSLGKAKWEAIGIYIGEKEGGNVSYAARVESFFDWIPEILNKSINDEANKVI